MLGPNPQITGLGPADFLTPEYIVFNITDFAFMYTIPLPSFFSAYIQQLHLNGGILIYSLFVEKKLFRVSGLPEDAVDEFYFTIIASNFSNVLIDLINKNKGGIMVVIMW